jgi:hypothetical protein
MRVVHRGEEMKEFMAKVSVGEDDDSYGMKINRANDFYITITCFKEPGSNPWCTFGGPENECRFIENMSLEQFKEWAEISTENQPPSNYLRHWKCHDCGKSFRQDNLELAPTLTDEV